MEIADLKYEIDSILHPKPDEDDRLLWVAPHSRLSTVHGLDTSYFRGPFDPKGDAAFQRLLDDESDPLHDTLECASVPLSLFTAAFQLFGDSLIEYHGRKKRWDVYRFYPPILMTIWAAFEAWVRISSKILVAVVPTLPPDIRNSLLEVRVVENNGKIEEKPNRKPVFQRYRLLLKYGCDCEYDIESAIWKAGDRLRIVRDSFVHYDVPRAPSLTASEVWNHIEAMLLLFIEPSTKLRRTLFAPQFDLYSTLAELQPLISEFEERPYHKGWPKDVAILDCPFDAADETKYRRRWSLSNSKETNQTVLPSPQLGTEEEISSRFGTKIRQCPSKSNQLQRCLSQVFAVSAEMTGIARTQIRTILSAKSRSKDTFSQFFGSSRRQ